MSNTTKKIFILSVLVTLLAIGGMSFLYYEIHTEGIRLEEQIAILSENTDKESAYLSLVRLAQETEEERNTLASSFFREESDSISFLGEIETLATSLGLKLHTDALEKTVDKESKQERITITFVYEGQKDMVFNFSKLLEVSPYHSRVESLALTRTPDGNWEGRLAISISINSI